MLLMRFHHAIRFLTCFVLFSLVNIAAYAKDYEILYSPPPLTNNEPYFSLIFVDGFPDDFLNQAPLISGSSVYCDLKVVMLNVTQNELHFKDTSYGMQFMIKLNDGSAWRMGGYFSLTNPDFTLPAGGSRTVELGLLEYLKFKDEVEAKNFASSGGCNLNGRIIDAEPVYLNGDLSFSGEQNWKSVQNHLEVGILRSQ